MTRVRKDGSRYWLSAHALNTTDHDIVLTMTDYCPLGPIRFTGLSAEYDYYDGCTKGACITHGQPMSIKIPARTEIELALVDIDPAGQGCNRPLERRPYEVSFEQPNLERSCGPDRQTIDLSPGAPATKRGAPAKPAAQCPPMPACGLACPGPMAHDDKGCPLCACEKTPSITR